MPRSCVTWKNAVFAIAAFLVVAVIASVLFDFGGPEFSDREQALLRDLEPQLGSLLVSEYDVPQPLGAFYDCTSDGSNPAVAYDTESRNSGSVDVTGADVTDDEGDNRADVQLCGEDGISYIAAVVSLQTSKDDQLYDLRVETELSRGKDEDIESVVMPIAESNADGGELLGVKWVEVERLGNAGWAYVAQVRYPDGSEVYIYDFDFTRNVVGAGVAVWLPSEIASEDHAVSIARAFDDKIKARVESLSAPMRGQ